MKFKGPLQIEINCSRMIPVPQNYYTHIMALEAQKTMNGIFDDVFFTHLRLQYTQKC
jgi:hypothetical protein